MCLEYVINDKYSRHQENEYILKRYVLINYSFCPTGDIGEHASLVWMKGQFNSVVGLQILFERSN